MTAKDSSGAVGVFAGSILSTYLLGNLWPQPPCWPNRSAPSSLRSATMRASWRREPHICSTSRGRASASAPPARPPSWRSISPARACCPRMRHGARRRRLGPSAAGRRLPLPGGQHPLARRPLPALRCGRAGHRLQRRRRRRRPEAAGRRGGRRRLHQRRHPRIGHQQRRQRQGRLHGSQRRRSGAGDSGSAGHGRDRPGSVSMVEAHAAGTRLGDPIEVAALKEVFGGCDAQLPARSVPSRATSVMSMPPPVWPG